MSLKDLLNKSKAAAKPVAKPIQSNGGIRGKLIQTREAYTKPALLDDIEEMVVEKKRPKLTLNFGGTQTGRIKVQESPIEELDAFAGLSDTLAGINNIVEKPVVEMDLSTSEKKVETQFSTPTLEDVSKFVFNEQPDQSTQEIADDFSSMLNELASSIGDQIPTNLSRCLKFMKENAFLADILKPENTQTLVQSIRKSYGYVVATQTEKGAKKKATAQKVNNVLDSLGGFSI